MNSQRQIDKVSELQDIVLRLDYLESTGDWISRSQAQQDPPLSEAGELVVKMASDLKKRIMNLVDELERELFIYLS
ncbi:MAG TPA: hypothetical protein PKA63_03805 [Oligoflexia bacterium]|nr:hypothetical protein [Oligoflexia bacterium]HMP47776.1 hypothetical protein [Oligoflexia bacterium]